MCAREPNANHMNTYRSFNETLLTKYYFCDKYKLCEQEYSLGSDSKTLEDHMNTRAA